MRGPVLSSPGGLRVRGSLTPGVRKGQLLALTSTPCKALCTRGMGLGKEPRKQTVYEGGCQSKALLLREPPGKRLVKMKSPHLRSHGGRGAPVLPQVCSAVYQPGTGPWREGPCLLCALVRLLVSKMGPCG